MLPPLATLLVVALTIGKLQTRYFQVLIVQQTINKSSTIYSKNHSEIPHNPHGKAGNEERRLLSLRCKYPLLLHTFKVSDCAKIVCRLNGRELKLLCTNVAFVLVCVFRFE